MDEHKRWILLNIGLAFILFGILLFFSCLLGGCAVGTPLPPNEPGVACPVCWGLGKDFGDFATPRIIPVRFFDLEPGEFWIPGAEQFLLMRHALEPAEFFCNWEIKFSVYTIHLGWGVLGSSLFWTNDETGKILFAAEPDDICVRRFVNNRIEPDGNQTFGGIAIVDIPQEPF